MLILGLEAFLVDSGYTSTLGGLNNVHKLPPVLIFSFANNLQVSNSFIYISVNLAEILLDFIEFLVLYPLELDRFVHILSIFLFQDLLSSNCHLFI